MFDEIKNFTLEEIEKRLAEIGTEIDAADEEKINSLNDELTALETRKGEIKMEERKADMKAVIEGAGNVIEKAPAKEERTLESVKASAEYVDAFANYIKTGSDKECRALLTDLVDGGSVPTPTVIDDFINTAWERANLISRVRRTSIKGTANFPFEYSATGASVHTEGSDAPAEEELVLGTVEIKPQMLKKWITVSDEVIELKGQAFLDYVYDEIEERILELADAHVIAAIKAAPAAATTSAAGVRAITVADVDFTTIFQAQAELVSGARNQVAIMNKKMYFNKFMGLKDTADRPIYNIVAENGSPSYYINGVEVLFDDSMKDNELIVGDLSGVMMNLPNNKEVSFVTDALSLAEKDLVKIVGKMYAGFGVIKDGYFCKVTLSSVSA